VPTAEGTLYFKEPEPPLDFEHRLIEILAAHRPELVTEVLFSDTDGRMLMRDAGEQLGTLLERDLDTRYWEEALPLYAELQIAAAEDAQRIVDVGTFDRRSALLPAVYERLTAERVPGQTPEEHAQLRALAPEAERAYDMLAASPVPETINNDDFTWGSIFVRNGAYRFLDWGDACVSHPFITLTVTQRVIEIKHGLPLGAPETARVRDAYLEPFTAFAPRAELEELVEPARRYGQICRVALRAETSWSIEDEDDLAWSFRLLLDPEAWRAWLDEPEDEQPPRSGPVS
jgi:hypothetical protein